MPETAKTQRLSIKTLDGLEHALTEIAGVYANQPDARTLCRAAVIEAKDRARYAARNLRAAPEKRALKQEMVDWMLVWLDDPAMFVSWLALRKAARTHSSLT